MRIKLTMCLAVTLQLFSLQVMAEQGDVERGRYLVEIGGCNDCHTPGYAQRMGKLADASWLMGDDIGFSGPWGVSFPTNLRLSAADMSWAAWQARINAGGLPPMPWPALRAMTETDQRAVYDFIRSLGRAGVAMPNAIPPGAPITASHIRFVPLPPDVLVSKE